jgi:DNA-binding LacI/PurR family transcriptional regulator
MALGAIAAIQEAGKSVPEDIAVIGFDDSFLAQNSHPGLTTVRQDIVGLGMEAAKMILAILRGEEVHSEILPCELVIRATA